MNITCVGALLKHKNKHAHAGGARAAACSTTSTNRSLQAAATANQWWSHCLIACSQSCAGSRACSPAAEAAISHCSSRYSIPIQHQRLCVVHPLSHIYTHLNPHTLYRKLRVGTPLFLVIVCLKVGWHHTINHTHDALQHTPAAPAVTQIYQQQQ